MSSFSISVPATSANIGPCFDSAGVALNLYLTLQVSKADNWEFVSSSPLLPSVTEYEDHFIYQIAKQTAEKYNKKLPACKVVMDSEIPLARGLGSSASAIIAGIELANQLCSLSLTTEEKLQYATDIEGHPDNAAPALFGGFIISAQLKDKIEWIQLPVLAVDIVVYIPNFELKTEAAREVIPAQFSKDKATAASGISNILIASLLAGNYGLAGKMMEEDLFHEPYRAELIPRYDEIKQEARNLGAYGTVISGAGPTMISFAPKGDGQAIAEKMGEKLPGYMVKRLAIDQSGVRVDIKMEKTAD